MTETAAPPIFDTELFLTLDNSHNVRGPYMVICHATVDFTGVRVLEIELYYNGTLVRRALGVADESALLILRAINDHVTELANTQT